jgi:small subunit ribosomal protein S9
LNSNIENFIDGLKHFFCMQEILARGVGRRKEAVAQVKIVKGTGLFLINDIPVQQYLHNNTCSILSVKAPLTILNAVSVSSQTNELPSDQNSNEAAIESTVQNENASFAQIDTIVKVKGGGLIGQAEAIKLGLARAICSLTITDSMTSQDEVRKQLKDKGYLTQDSRVKERRKYGLKKARKATQYNKR